MKDKSIHIVAPIISLLIIGSVVIGLVVTGKGVDLSENVSWTNEEISLMQSLVLEEQENESNEALAELGHQLFFDTALSSNGEVACASCHQPEKYFTDGEALSSAGMGKLSRHTPSIVGASTQTWYFWDGRKDSLWSQALGPLESGVEHGTNRLAVVRHVTEKYSAQYRDLFGEMPDLESFPLDASPVGENDQWQKNWQAMSEQSQDVVNKAFVNVGLAIAEYEKLIQVGESRFDVFAKALGNGNKSDALNAYEQEGLKLFLDKEKTGCINCHNGAMFTNHDFLATGVENINPDKLSGRAQGIKDLLADEFNCLANYTGENCDELRFAKTEGRELNGAFKVPSLRNVANTAPYMHDGKFKNLFEVLKYYNEFSPEKDMHVDIQAMRLLPHELKYLEAFLVTLSAPIAAEQRWLQAPETPSTHLAGTGSYAGNSTGDF